MWKDIKKYEGKYQINEKGDIRSLIFVNNRGEKNRKIPIIMKPQLRNNYKIINLCKNGKRKQYSVHRLVAETFIDNPNNYNIVNHKDFNTLNNHKDNLEWCTQKQNVLHSICNMINKPHIQKGKEYCIYKRKYSYEVTIKGKYYGTFKTIKEAREKRDEELKKIFDFEQFERVLLLQETC